MITKETIAFIGNIGETCPLLLKRLAQMDLRLLFIYNEERQGGKMSDLLELKNTVAEIEMIPCAKEGCWEADMIAFVDPEDIQIPLMARIKEVATQKILLCITEGKDKKIFFSEAKIKELQQGLPHSKIVQVFIVSDEMSATMLGGNKEALETSSEILENAGYKINLEAETL